MPNATTRANAKALPKTNPDPDAAIFAIVTQLASVQSRYDVACKAFDEAEERRRKIETPRELFKTEEDARLRLFASGYVGEAYRPSEIAAIGAILRAIKSDRGLHPAFPRGQTIIDVWSKWITRKRAEDARSDYDAADRAQQMALSEFSHVIKQLLMTPARTVAGVLAKARALEDCVNAENLTEVAQEQIDSYGAFEREPAALSLFADLISLSTQEARA